MTWTSTLGPHSVTCMDPETFGCRVLIPQQLDDQYPQSHLTLRRQMNGISLSFAPNTGYMLAWGQVKSKVFLHDEGGHSPMMGFFSGWIRGTLFSKITQYWVSLYHRRIQGTMAEGSWWSRDLRMLGEPCSWVPTGLGSSAPHPAEVMCCACPGLKTGDCSKVGLEIQALLPRLDFIAWKSQTKFQNTVRRKTLDFRLAVRPLKCPALQCALALSSGPTLWPTGKHDAHNVWIQEPSSALHSSWTKQVWVREGRQRQIFSLVSRLCHCGAGGGGSWNRNAQQPKTVRETSKKSN